MKPPNLLLDKLPFLSTADAYFCFLRSWWDGAGIDALVWWRNSSGCYQHLIKTGETTTPKPPHSEVKKQIASAELEELLREVTALGFQTFSQQTKRLIYSHCDDWYGLKTASTDVERWLQVMGGKHDNPKVMLLLDKVFDIAPQLLADSPPEAPGPRG